MADKFLFLIVIALMTIGLLFSYSLPVYLELTNGWGEFYFFKRFLMFSLVGIFIMYAFSQCNPDKCISKIGWLLFLIGGISIFLMPTPILSSYCPTIKGANRWIKVFGFSIAPIEFFKIGLIYFFAWSFSRKLIPQKFSTVTEEVKAIFPYLAVLGFVAFYVIIFQSDLGETLLILMIFLVMLSFTSVSSKLFAGLLSAGVFIFIIGIMQKEYRIERIKSMLYNVYLMLPESIQNFFNISISSSDISYQIRQSINAIHNGGISGVGIGNGEIKLGFLSDVHTDFVLSGIAEEIGFLGVFCIVILFLFLIKEILKISNRIEAKTHNDYVFKLFTAGIAILISIEMILNIMGIIGLFPLKGLPIPFVSYGGSAIISFSIAIGMVLMISKKAKL